MMILSNCTDFRIGDRVEYNPDKSSTWARFDGTEGVVIGHDIKRNRVLVRWDEKSALCAYDSVMRVSSRMILEWVRWAPMQMSDIPEPEDSDLE